MRAAWKIWLTMMMAASLLGAGCGGAGEQRNDLAGPTSTADLVTSPGADALVSTDDTPGPDDASDGATPNADSAPEGDTVLGSDGDSFPGPDLLPQSDATPQADGDLPLPDAIVLPPAGLYVFSGNVLSGVDDAPLANVTVTAMNCEGCAIQTVSTDAQGRFRFETDDPANALTPDASVLAVRIAFDLDGYHKRVIYRKPDYHVDGDVSSYEMGDVRLFLAGPDSDGDGLSDAHELYLGLDPNNADTDRDGIPDGWEVDGNGGVDYAAFGCDPKMRDILVELDYHHYIEDGKLKSARFSDAIITKLTAFFAALPVETPLPGGDKTTGIAIHIVPDSQLPKSHQCYYGSGSAGDHSPANPLFELAFHKATVCIAKGSGFRGNSPISGRTLKYFSPETNDDPSDDWTESAQLVRFAVFVHELGHSLGLLHGGNEDANFKPNYTSLMNYAYDVSFNGSPKSLEKTEIHFSDGRMPDIDENHLSDRNPFAGFTVEQLGFLSHFQKGKGGAYNVAACLDNPLEVCVDWNKNDLIDEDYALNIRPGSDTTGFTVLKDHNDFTTIAKKMAKALPCNPNP